MTRGSSTGTTGPLATPEKIRSDPPRAADQTADLAVASVADHASMDQHADPIGALPVVSGPASGGRPYLVEMAP